MTTRSTTPPRPQFKKGCVRVAVVGAGVAGLACARVLVGAGCDVRVFDKGRRAPGGRLHTRSVQPCDRAGRAHGAPSPPAAAPGSGGSTAEVGELLTFDDGAQYFTAREAEFRAVVEAWVAHSCAKEWTPLRMAVIDREGDVRLKPDDDRGGTAVRRYVGSPTMHAVVPFLARPVAHTIAQAVCVAQVQRREDGATWRLVGETGEELGVYEAVVVATPPRQAANMLTHAPVLRDRAAAVHMHPCWALGVAFDKRQEAIKFDGAFVNAKASPLSWIARNSSKPDRSEQKECWILHGSAAWSAEHIEDDPETVSRALLDGFKRAVRGAIDEPSYVGTAFRWRYAIPEKPLPERFLYDAALRIGVCGDWCGGPRVEGAFLSGHLLGQHMKSSL